LKPSFMFWKTVKSLEVL